MNLLRKLIRESISKIIFEADHSKVMMTLSNLALSVSDAINAGEVNLDLHDRSTLIASATLKNITTEEYPCIPETLSVSTIYTNPSYQGTGIGELLLDLIFYYAEFEYGKKAGIDDRKPRGITTDFVGGNTPIINYIINKAISDPNYYEQETANPYRNKKMDFFNKTPDPNDDCYSEMFDNDGAYELIDDLGMSEEEAYEELGYDDENFPIGTFSSWRKRGIDNLSPIWKDLTSRTAPYHFNRVRSADFIDAHRSSPTSDEIKRYQKEKRIKEMKLSRRQLRSLIESIGQQTNASITSLNEDLYASKEEEEEAIKDMMNLYSISYEEAAKTIKSAGDEMDEQPGWQESISLEKEQIDNLNDFLEQSQRGKQLVQYHIFHDVVPDYQAAISNFKSNYAEYVKSPKKFRGLSVGKLYSSVQKGYEVYKDIIEDVELFSKYHNLIKQLEKEDKKSILTKDFSLNMQASMIQPDLDLAIKKRQQSADRKLALAAMSLKQQLIGSRYFDLIKNKKKLN